MGNQIEYRHLRYFLAVAKDLHFRKAAERLYISQPGLSRQIKQMEDDLGVLLFERHNRKVELTEAGLYLKTELTRNLKELEDILRHAKLLNTGISGNLRFGYIGSAMHQLIPNLLLKFKNEYPNVTFTLREMDNQRQIKNLLLKNIDVGFVRLERVPKTLTIVPVLKEPFCLVLPKDHPLHTKVFKSLNQLKNESFILFDPTYNPYYYEKVMHLFDDSGFSPIISHNTIHANSIYRLVENGFGISIVPRSLQLGYNTMGVKFIELKGKKHQTVLSVVWNTSNRNPVLDNFIALFT